MRWVVFSDGGVFLLHRRFFGFPSGNTDSNAGCDMGFHYFLRTHFCTYGTTILTKHKKQQHSTLWIWFYICHGTPVTHHSQTYRNRIGRAYLVHCACWYRLIRIVWFRSTISRIMITATWTKVATVFRAITKAVPSNLLIVWTPSSAISCETLDPIWLWFYTNSPQM